MATFDRNYYVRLVEQEYFGSVMQEDMAAVIACFTNDAEFVIYNGDNEVRRSYGSPKGDQVPLETFYDQLFANYNILVEEFEHTIDVDAERCASNFTVTLKPKDGSEYEDTGTLVFSNSNFFRCRKGKIHFMTVYFANQTRLTGG